MNIPINRWSIALALTAVVWIAAERTKDRGVYDSGPTLAAVAALIATLAFWAGVAFALFP